MIMQYIAFVCGHNAGRSQMAQATFNTLKKINSKVDSRYEAISWGTGIGKQVILDPAKPETNIVGVRDTIHGKTMELIKELANNS